MTRRRPPYVCAECDHGVVQHGARGCKRAECSCLRTEAELLREKRPA